MCPISLHMYTSQLPTYPDPVMDLLDPERVILHRLYRCKLNLKQDLAGLGLWWMKPGSP